VLPEPVVVAAPVPNILRTPPDGVAVPEFVTNEFETVPDSEMVKVLPAPDTLKLTLPTMFRTLLEGTAVPELPTNEVGTELSPEMVKRLDPGVPTMLIVVPSPTILTLLDMSGPTAPPLFPVTVRIPDETATLKSLHVATPRARLTRRYAFVVAVFTQIVGIVKLLSDVVGEKVRLMNGTTI
jgi:hypothetical protein